MICERKLVSNCMYVWCMYWWLLREAKCSVRTTCFSPYRRVYGRKIKKIQRKMLKSCCRHLIPFLWYSAKIKILFTRILIFGYFIPKSIFFLLLWIISSVCVCGIGCFAQLVMGALSLILLLFLFTPFLNLLWTYPPHIYSKYLKEKIKKIKQWAMSRFSLVLPFLGGEAQTFFFEIK